MSCATEHTPQPEGYLQWHGWAREMSRTHIQSRCSECGLWWAWAPKFTTNGRRQHAPAADRKEGQ